MKHENCDVETGALNTSQVTLDQDLAVILGNASNAAYLDFKRKTFEKTLLSRKERYDYYDRFYGLDSVPWGTGSKERFGLIYVNHNDPSTVLIAFRGTASILDAFKDVESIGTKQFVPHIPHPGFPTNVEVGDGFYDIYSQSNSSLPSSMQSQLFTYLDALKPKHIIITGHSLGCPLGTLFALDVAVCRPTQLSNINFASPRVGKDVWKATYEKYVTNTTAPGAKKNQTIRIVNNYDRVPTLPPNWLLFPFKHVGLEFKVSFTLDTYTLDFSDLVLSWHSLNNYQTVVNNAVTATPQGWGGLFVDAPFPTWKMISYNPFKTRSTPEADFLLSAITKKGEKAQNQ